MLTPSCRWSRSPAGPSLFNHQSLPLPHPPMAGLRARDVECIRQVLQEKGACNVGGRELTDKTWWCFSRFWWETWDNFLLWVVKNQFLVDEIRYFLNKSIAGITIFSPLFSDKTCLLLDGRAYFFGWMTLLFVGNFHTWLSPILVGSPPDIVSLLAIFVAWALRPVF